MITLSDYKKFYTTGNVFELDGNDYVGYVEVLSGSPFTFETRYTLTPKSTFKTDFYLSDLFFDRLATDENFTLPKTKEDCEFALNETLNYETLRYKLNNISENTNYIYSRLFIPNNLIPAAPSVQFAGIAAKQDYYLTTYNVGGLGSTNNYIDTIPFAYSDHLQDLSYIKESTAQLNYDGGNSYALFTITDNTFISLTGDETTINIIEKSTGYETLNNSLSFGYLTDICSTSKYVFITDTANNVVLKYDVAGYINNDYALANKRNFIELVGNSGTGTSSSNLNAPTKLACCEAHDVVAVCDSGNYVIKLYDTNFNFKTSIKQIPLKKETLGAMGFDPHYNNLNVITYYGSDIYLYTFDLTFNLIERTLLEEKLKGDTIRSIQFSYNDSNFWYIVTSSYIYKKIKSRASKTVGLFDPLRLYDLNLTRTTSASDAGFNNKWNYQEIGYQEAAFKWNLYQATGTGSGSGSLSSSLVGDVYKTFNVLKSPENYDLQILITNSKIFTLQEPNTYKTVIKQDNYENYGIAGFNLNGDEYIQTSVLNREIFKMVSDIVKIKNNIVGRFTGKYVNNIFNLTTYTYRLNFDNFIDENTINDFYIYGNEQNMVGVINRTFNKIYQLQEKLLELTLTDFDVNVQTLYGESSYIQV